MKISKLFSSLEKTDQLPSNVLSHSVISSLASSKYKSIEKNKFNLVDRSSLFAYLNDVAMLGQLTTNAEQTRKRSSRRTGLASLLEKQIPKLVPYVDKVDDFI